MGFRQSVPRSSSTPPHSGPNAEGGGGGGGGEGVYRGNLNTYMMIIVRDSIEEVKIMWGPIRTFLILVSLAQLVLNSVS